MTSKARTSISALPRGHELSPATFRMDADLVARYQSAVGDGNRYDTALPPLAVVALGLEALQSEISLPEGSLHTGQEVEHQGALLVGDTLTMTGRVAQRSERQGYVISVIVLQISGSSGGIIRARATIMAPMAGAA
jgi:hypothetical protein